MTKLDDNKCAESHRISAYAHRTLAKDETPAFEAHLAECPLCRDELERSRPVVDFFVPSVTLSLRPSENVHERLARRISDTTGGELVLPTARECSEPEWEQVAPGISCKLLATDSERSRVSMLVRLAPDVEYPPHEHAGVEELHLLDGELWIDDRKLRAGDYNRAEPGTSDRRVWSETGCTCVLITSTRDVLG